MFKFKKLIRPDILLLLSINLKEMQLTQYYYNDSTIIETVKFEINFIVQAE